VVATFLWHLAPFQLFTFQLHLKYVPFEMVYRLTLPRGRRVPAIHCRLEIPILYPCITNVSSLYRIFLSPPQCSISLFLPIHRIILKQQANSQDLRLRLSPPLSALQWYASLLKVDPCDPPSSIIPYFRPYYKTPNRTSLKLSDFSSSPSSHFQG